MKTNYVVIIRNQQGTTHFIITTSLVDAFEQTIVLWPNPLLKQCIIGLVPPEPYGTGE